MMISIRLRAALLFALLLPVSLAWAQTSEEEAKLIQATTVLTELRSVPDQGVPTWLLDRAYGIAVIPDVIKGAFIFGGRHGWGVISARDPNGRFSDPAFVSLTGGSWGFQIGAQSTDVVLIFATKRSLDNFGRGQFTLGATASVAAGPVGRQGEALAGIDAEIYSYSRSRGLFAGLALDGSAITFNKDANHDFYGRAVSAAEIFSGSVTSNSESARRFIAAIAAGLSQPAPSAATPAATTAPVPSTPAPASTSTGAQTFPLEDAKPGSEPH
jgi:lipid-binding SYLF domain-containing protein